MKSLNQKLVTWMSLFVLGLGVSEEKNSQKMMYANESKLSSGISAALIFSEDLSDFTPSTVLKIRAMSLEGFNQEGLSKMRAAMSFMEKVVNSEEFKYRVLNFTNRQGKRNFTSNRGLSNEQIYQIFMEGRETLQPETPGEANFYLKLYYRPLSRVIGYTTPTTSLININWKYFSQFDVPEVAGNLTHEWAHKIGFGHSSARDLDSPPYALGYIVRDMIQKSLLFPLTMRENKVRP